MKFADEILVRLGDPASRRALFGAVVAERLVAACYGGLNLFAGPFSADPANLTIGAALDAQPRLRGHGRGPDGRFFEFDADFTDFAPVRPAYPALVEGSLSASLTDVSGRIASVVSTTGLLPPLDQLDAGASNSERSNADKLERRRRIELVKAIADPGLADDAALMLAGEWTDAAGVEDIPALLEKAAGPAGAARLAMQFELLDAGAARLRTARFAAGVIIGDPTDAESDLLGMVAQAREVQRLLRAAGHLTTPLGGIEPVVGTPVIWFVPKATFDDQTWPVGGNVPAGNLAQEREKRAAGWLAGQGIVLAGVG